MGHKRTAQPGPQTPAADAARRLVRSRLGSVGRLVADSSPKRIRKVEYIHQLRVSIRRADAAINAFEPRVGGTEVIEARKRLRSLRKAAGAARDCDSHAAILASLLAGDSPDRRHLTKYLSGRLQVARRIASRKALDAARPSRARKLKAARKALVASVSSPDDRPWSFNQAATEALSRTLNETRTAANEDLGDLNHVHGLRVAAKQVRYAVELFRPCLPGALCDGSLIGLREFQSLLGRVNDARQVTCWLAEEASVLTESRRPRGIPRGATVESIYEELRVLLGRFEAELESAHAAAIPEIAVRLDAALQPLEQWVHATGEPSPAAGVDRASAGRDAQGPDERAGHTVMRRHIPVLL